MVLVPIARWVGSFELSDPVTRMPEGEGVDLVQDGDEVRVVALHTAGNRVRQAGVLAADQFLGSMCTPLAVAQSMLFLMSPQMVEAHPTRDRRDLVAQLYGGVFTCVHPK